MTSSEEMLAGYAAQHGYGAEFEPDWTAAFGATFGTNPDFLLTRDGVRAVVEVRGFASNPLTDALGDRRAGVVDRTVLAKPLYRGLAEKAQQLEDFAEVGVPLVIALANVDSPEIDLGRHLMIDALFGTSSHHVPIDPSGTHDLGPGRTVAEPGYGVFGGTAADGEPRNIWPHISGVLVLGRADLYAEFKRADLDRYIEERSPADHPEEIALVAEWMETPVGRGEAEGPRGFDYFVSFYDLAGYALGSGSPVPSGWFSGPRDQRSSFDASGTEFSVAA